MPAAQAKANYKTYEAQARMVRAIVAAHPEVKWNYKEIASCYGSDMSDHALNHRFRRLRAQAIIIREGRALGLDMKDLTTDEKILPSTQEKTQGSVDNNIAKYFGQSTADGIQFQFRTIKKDADQLRQVHKDGGNVANCLSLGAGSMGPSTPSKTMATPSRRSGATSKRSRTSVKPVATTPASLIKRSSSDEEDEGDAEVDYDQMDETPSKRVKTTGRSSITPSRHAAVRASATITNSVTQLSTSESPEDTTTPQTDLAPTEPAYTQPASIFGNPERKPTVVPQPEPDIFNTGFSSSFARNGSDEFMGSNSVSFSGQGSLSMSTHDEYLDMDNGDGEI